MRYLVQQREVGEVKICADVSVAVMYSNRDEGLDAPHTVVAGVPRDVEFCKLPGKHEPNVPSGSEVTADRSELWASEARHQGIEQRAQTEHDQGCGWEAQARRQSLGCFGRHRVGYRGESIGAISLDAELLVRSYCQTGT